MVAIITVGAQFIGLLKRTETTPVPWAAEAEMISQAVKR